ncbi:phenylacetate-CoA oxygenase subunit PaaJ [Micrococcales bacterium 31B]|nr:phenylacetate-CoA oxygenase subunit PaaJ [Micrococcales bacterium 31B]
MVTATDLRPREPQAAAAWDIAARVKDPEVPALTIADLGVLRAVTVTPAEGSDARVVEVTLTPTYSGCPAVDQMRDDVIMELTAAGYETVRVTMTLTPAWSTDWMSDVGKAKLEAYGIAPPNGKAPVRRGALPMRLAVKCPRCHSINTREVSRYGSTSCKSLYECLACQEPFDYFKVH